jgi:hypothetical protein
MEETAEARGTISERNEGRLEFVAAVLLGMAALVTAWAAFQASQYDGKMLTSFTEANLTLSDANALYNEGTQEYIEDELLFIQYVTAIQQDDIDMAAYLRESLMSDRLVASIEWWEQQPDDSGFDTPFVDENPNFIIQQYVDGDALVDETDASFQAGQDANDTGDKFNLITVLLAASLFLLGIATTFKVLSMRIACLGIGAALFVGATAWLLTLPTA